MASTLKQLAQAQATITATSIYSPGTGGTGIIRQIIVCNTDTVTRMFDIYIDDDGTVYDATTALYYEVSIGPKETYNIPTKWFMNNSAGNLAVKADAAGVVTITVMGVVKI